MEDTLIVQLFWKRDEEAITQCERKYGRQCRGIARDILCNDEDSEECVNDAFCAAWDSIPPSKPSYLGAYLYRIVRNISLNRLKEQRSQKRGGGELTAVLDELSDCLSSGRSVEREYEQRELVCAINEFLFTLPKNERVIFTARYYLFLPTKLIAQRTGFGKSRINTSLHRTRKKLNAYLKKEGLL